MSPTAFRQQFTHLLNEVTHCYELCTSIRQYRRIGNKHEALNSLQDTLSSSYSALQMEYDTLRKRSGSRMDIGDEQSRQELDQSIRIISNDIRTRLEDLAYRRDSSDGYSHSSHGHSQRPGFRDLLRKWNRVEIDVEDTLQTLSYRLESSETTLMRVSKSEPSHKKDDFVSSKDLDRMMDHMQSSWEEILISGQVLYVNCWDATKTQWERPEGAFVKTLKRKGSWERVRPEVTYQTSDAFVQGW